MKEFKNKEVFDKFLEQSGDFLIASELLCDKFPDKLFVIYYLLGLSIELSLKSYLLYFGIDTKEIRKLNHNIQKLLKKYLEHKIHEKFSINAIEIGVIEVLNIDYSTKRLEYRDGEGDYYIPNIRPTRNIARKLVSQLKQLSK